MRRQWGAHRACYRPYRHGGERVSAQGASRSISRRDSRMCRGSGFCQGASGSILRRDSQPYRGDRVSRRGLIDRSAPDRGAPVEARSCRGRGETAKSGKTRWVPISTNRLQALLDYLRLDVEGQRKVSEALVFSNVIGQPIGDFRSAWKRTLKLANIADLRWHDLRHEYASRLVVRGTPLSQVRDLLGHASITTTERYDNQRPEALMEAAKRLETGETFTIPSQQAVGDTNPVDSDDAKGDAKLLEDDGLSEGRSGVGNGVRTL